MSVESERQAPTRTAEGQQELALLENWKRLADLVDAVSNELFVRGNLELWVVGLQVSPKGTGCLVGGGAGSRSGGAVRTQ